MTAEPSKVVEDFNAQSGAMRTDILAKRRAMPFAEKDSAHSKPSLHLSQNDRVLRQCKTENFDLQSDLNDSKGRIQDLLRKK
jgi:hypothetical protein